MGRVCCLARQFGATHQIFVDRACSLAAFTNGPDNQRLATAHIASSEDLVDIGLIVIGVVAAGGGVAGGYWGGEAGAFFGERLGDKVNSL